MRGRREGERMKDGEQDEERGEEEGVRMGESEGVRGRGSGITAHKMSNYCLPQLP